MNLSVNFMGLNLKNPIIVAAGPWSRNGESIRRALKAGAGAVVTETILNEIRPNVSPELAYRQNGVQNIRLYSEIELEEWEDEIAIAKSDGGIVIANILAHTPSEMAYIASRMEKFGADAIELGVSSPHGEGIEVLASDSLKVFEMARLVCETVKIPVMVKMSASVTNMPKLVRALEKSGASGISAIDSIRSIIGVDIKTGKPFLPTYGGYSGAPIRPIGLATTATIAQSTHLPVCGMGGIESFENVLEYIMLGASAIQIGTSIMLNGYSHIGKVLDDLSSWMVENNHESLSEIKGKALLSLKSFEEIEILPLVSSVKEKCLLTDCHLCIDSCIYDAISKSGSSIIINTLKCNGCGLCVGLCPTEKFELILK